MASYQTPIQPKDLPAMVGKCIHLNWARAGCVWILERIEGDTMHLITPSTGKRRMAHINDACYTRKHDPTQRGMYPHEYGRKHVR